MTKSVKVMLPVGKHFEADLLAKEDNFARVQDRQTLDISWHPESYVVDLKNEEFPKQTIPRIRGNRTE